MDIKEFSDRLLDMRFSKNKKKYRTQKTDNSRMNLILAIIFLLGASIIYKLYELQIVNYDLYSAKAQGQHQISSVIEPKRGKIFIQARGKNGFELYPIATNKEFASLYAAPKDVFEPGKMAQIFYNFFHKADIEEEVEERFKKEDKERLEQELEFAQNNFLGPEKALKEAEVIAEHEARLRDGEFLELRRLKREKEIREKYDKVIKSYIQKLTKKNDPYEPLQAKVDEETLKKLYLALLPITRYETIFYPGYDFSNRDIDRLLEGISEADLEIKNNRMIAKCSDGEKRALGLDGIGFIMKTYRFYPEGHIGSNMLGFVKSGDNGLKGQYGLEGFFDEELRGVSGLVKADLGAGGDMIVINGREFSKARDGSALVLTIDRTIQYYACQKLAERSEAHEADGASVIIMEPATGAILAMCSWPDYDPNIYQEVENINVYNNPAIFYQYEPGSVFKTFTFAAAIDREMITPETTYEDKGFLMIEGWPKPIRNSDYATHGSHGVVSMNTALEESLNTGSIFAMRQAGRYHFAQYVRDFGFGEKTGIELDTEVAGNIRKLNNDKIYEIYAATASFGQGITATPLQLINGYAAIANGGVLMKPQIVREVIYANGQKEKIEPKKIRRVVSEETAALVGGMLANVVEGGHAKHAAAPGYWVGGKTGTAQMVEVGKKGYSDATIHTFIGYAPIEEPRFVMLVKIDNPKDVKYSASSAAPLFGEIAKFLMDYWEAPKDRMTN